LVKCSFCRLEAQVTMTGFAFYAYDRTGAHSRNARGSLGPFSRLTFKVYACLDHCHWLLDLRDKMHAKGKGDADWSEQVYKLARRDLEERSLQQQVRKIGKT